MGSDVLLEIVRAVEEDVEEFFLGEVCIFEHLDYGDHVEFFDVGILGLDEELVLVLGEAFPSVDCNLIHLILIIIILMNKLLSQLLQLPQHIFKMGALNKRNEI